jgi:hypothetical protein
MPAATPGPSSRGLQDETLAAVYSGVDGHPSVLEARQATMNNESLLRQSAGQNHGWERPTCFSNHPLRPRPLTIDRVNRLSPSSDSDVGMASPLGLVPTSDGEPEVNEAAGQYEEDKEADEAENQSENEEGDPIEKNQDIICLERMLVQVHHICRFPENLSSTDCPAYTVLVEISLEGQSVILLALAHEGDIGQAAHRTWCLDSELGHYTGNTPVAVRGE